MGDLTLKFTLDVKERKGVVRVELVKAGVANRCEFDLETGLVSLWRGDRQVGPPTPAGIARPGTYAVSFANVDDRLTLRVDDRLPFGEGICVDPDGALAPTAADLDPVGIAAQGRRSRSGDLVLSRDIYYTFEPARLDYDDLDLDERFPTDPVAMFDWLADPEEVPAARETRASGFPDRSRAVHDARRQQPLEPRWPGMGANRPARDRAGVAAGTTRAARAGRCPSRSWSGRPSAFTGRTSSRSARRSAWDATCGCPPGPTSKRCDGFADGLPVAEAGFQGGLAASPVRLTHWHDGID